MEKKIEDRIELYIEIYLKAFEKALKVNSNNARYIASEIFKEIARDLRSELISKLQRENGKTAGTKTENTEEIHPSDPKEENTEPATEKQRHALHKFGLKNIPEYLTKKAASEILGILVHHSKEGDTEAIASLVGKFNSEWAEVNENNSSLK